MNATRLGPALVWAAIALPVLLALTMCVPRLRAAGAMGAPFAALPALVLALVWPEGARLDLPRTLVGMTLAAHDELTRGFLLLTASLWLASAWFTPAYMAGDPRRDRFWGYFLASMAGNVGLVLARDVVSFYAFFSLMTFAAYGVIVHEQTREARRAAHVYFVLAFGGELLLLGSLLLITGGDAYVSLADARAFVASSPHREALTVLLLAGFGVKAGAVPLHVWLPLAHPVAPTPASAVLSGAMIKAGLLGWLRFLPAGQAMPSELGWLCATLGFVAALGGALIGATQQKAKTVLAYSSISQMGLMTMVFGVVLASDEAATASVAAIAFFALHHAFAKGSLFLGTAVAQRASEPWTRRLVAGGLLLPALSIAGAPLSTGALAKVALHDAVEHGLPHFHVLATLLSIAAIGSTLVMIRFLVCAVPPTRRGDGRLGPALVFPWLALVVGDVWLLFGAPVERPATEQLVKAEKLWTATWPVLAGALLAVTARVSFRLRGGPFVVPTGDLLVLAEVAIERVGRRGAAVRARARAVTETLAGADVAAWVVRWADHLGRTIDRAQRGLADYAVIGALLALLLLLVLVLLVSPPL